MKISKMANSVQPSLTRQLFNMAKQYNDVIDLTLGDPDVIPNIKIRNAACNAILKGKTRYSANAGLIEFRNSVAKNFENEYGIQISPTDNIIATIGGMEALFLSLSTIIDKGDEVILQAPFYVNYVQMIQMCGGIPIVIESKESNKFVLDCNELKKAVSNKTVAIIINSPCNPTGQIISGDALDEIAKIAVEKDLVVISDEVYRTLIFNGEKHNSIATRSGMLERTIVIDSLSKRFAMTGYRIGYAIAPKIIIENMTKMQENVVACAPLPSQYAGIEAYNHCSEDTSVCEIYEKRCKQMSNAINKINGIHCLEPVSTFYLFINIEATKLKSIDFAYKLLEQQHVAIAPGVAYGTAYDSYVRVACTLDEGKILEGANRIKSFVDSIMKQ